MLYLTLEVYLNDEAKFDSNSLMIVVIFIPNKSDHWNG